jgi:hypothetical protein
VVIGGIIPSDPVVALHLEVEEIAHLGKSVENVSYRENASRFEFEGTLLRQHVESRLSLPGIPHPNRAMRVIKLRARLAHLTNPDSKHSREHAVAFQAQTLHGLFRTLFSMAKPN